MLILETDELIVDTDELTAVNDALIAVNELTDVEKPDPVISESAFMVEAGVPGGVSDPAYTWT